MLAKKATTKREEILRDGTSRIIYDLSRTDMCDCSRLWWAVWGKGMVKDRRSADVEKEDFLGHDDLDCWGSCECIGEEARVLGVRGDADPEEDSSLDGESSGTGAVEECDDARVAGVWGWRNWTRWERQGRVEGDTAFKRPWWWLRMSASVMPSSKSRTSRYSRSMRPTSRLPKTPVQSAQWTFLSVESFKYCKGEWAIEAERRGGANVLTLEATMMAPRKTRSKAHSSRAIWRWGLALSM